MIEFNNLTSISINGSFFKKIAGKVLKKEKKVLELSIVLVDEQRIKELNKKYRKINKATDVLSFLYNGSGEIVICPETVKENAKRFGTTFKKELTRILIHGILHLLGKDHKTLKEAKRMERKQEYYLNLIWR